ncbi:hypothetical protein HRR83_005590 [Exophiala dermatitidis]|uniref:Uncharacterized protein n=1 Tax=Exophiala dermatitidis TaxID=5970 RepID=A0AAN6IRW1_EXODE|nr:hypothetical protein HRR74_009211 [Exophiala dermatitidis]KAJ4508140.1 hypothetical protein HRR73_007578 [Exophiala dermatitidis]KAJ4531936.1 hypothetical protein HRR77_009068 [Exophiala dermatitidis]KAJ4540051.1 hypothetical protein HRR76_003469 [Exophiala dermatitidis]KAJ4557156.1 hypothetical protein HRR79_008621 [Exophiala dermatitidis]
MLYYCPLLSLRSAIREVPPPSRPLTAPLTPKYNSPIAKQLLRLPSFLLLQGLQPGSSHSEHPSIAPEVVSGTEPNLSVRVARERSPKRTPRPAVNRPCLSLDEAHGFHIQGHITSHPTYYNTP